MLVGIDVAARMTFHRKHHLHRRFRHPRCRCRCRRSPRCCSHRRRPLSPSAPPSSSSRMSLSSPGSSLIRPLSGRSIRQHHFASPYGTASPYRCLRKKSSPRPRRNLPSPPPAPPKFNVVLRHRRTPVQKRTFFSLALGTQPAPHQQH